MLTLVVVLSLVTYRVTRFVLSDSLIATPRIWLHQVIIGKSKAWRMKLYELLTCSYCMSIWVAGGAVLLTLAVRPVPLPVWVWLASAAGSVIVWQYVEE